MSGFYLREDANLAFEPSSCIRAWTGNIVTELLSSPSDNAGGVVWKSSMTVNHMDEMLIEKVIKIKQS